MAKKKQFKILIDVDGTITQAPEFFAALTQQFALIADIHIVTARFEQEDRALGNETKKQLREWGIKYHHLVFTSDKALYCIENGINIVFEDVDEYFKGLPESVTVFKIRETHNYCWKTHRWVYDESTGVDIYDV